MKKVLIRILIVVVCFLIISLVDYLRHPQPLTLPFFSNVFWATMTGVLFFGMFFSCIPNGSKGGKKWEYIIPNSNQLFRLVLWLIPLALSTIVYMGHWNDITLLLFCKIVLIYLLILGGLYSVRLLFV